MGQTPHQQRHAQRNIETEKGKKKETLSRYGKDGIIFVILTFWNGASQVASSKEDVYNAGDAGSIPGWENPLEEEMITHSSILVWKIP